MALDELGQRLGDVRRLDDDAGVREQDSGLGVPLAAEPRSTGGSPSVSARYGSGAIPIPPPTRSGRSTSSRKPFPSGPKTWRCVARLDLAERPRAGPDRLEQEAELPGRGQAEAHRPRQERVPAPRA